MPSGGSSRRKSACSWTPCWRGSHPSRRGMRSSTFRKEHKQHAAVAGLRKVRRARRVMHERPGRIVARAIVERAGHDVDLLRPGMVHVELQEARARIDLEDLSLGTVRRLPEQAPADPRIDLARFDVILVHMDDVGHGTESAHDLEVRHHARGMVLEDVTVVHPFAGPVVGHPRDANPTPSWNVDRVLPRTEFRRLAVHLENLEKEAMKVERMVDWRPVDDVPDLELSHSYRLSAVVQLLVDRELDAVLEAERPAQANFPGCAHGAADERVDLPQGLRQ